MSNFKYDAAFSFLSQDESLAQRLADIVSERYEVFLYSERQMELAGKDGEQEFSDVFSNQARTVVILYRENWGKTSWTRIEETAIRNRAHDRGYDFTLFIPLGDPKTLPPWLPRNRLYCDLERFGEQSAAAVIIARITEQAGEPRPASTIDEAKRLQADLKFKEEVKVWATTENGVQQVIKCVEDLYAELEKQIKQISADNPASAFQIDKGRSRDLVVYHRPVSMTFDLYIQYGNSMKDVALKVRHWNAEIVRSRSVMYPFGNPKVIFDEEFVPELTRDKTIRWRSSRTPHRSYEDRTLLDHCMKGFMDRIRES